MTPTSLSALIKAQAYGLGFDLVGIAPLGPVATATAFTQWLASGYAGTMNYLQRGAEKRQDTRRPFESARSAVVVGLSYGGREPAGPVARYARGDDYHDLIADKLHDLHRWIDAHVGRGVAGKAYVDTGPILERDLARRAGLGWFGKNTNLINPRLGSFFFIGTLLVDLQLDADAAFAADHCGSCTRCLDACPTNAFAAPRQLDATRCISYLTIELREAIPADLRAAVGDRLYGCDICQDVCPWNERFSRPNTEPALAPRDAVAGKDARTLARELLEMTEQRYQTSFRRSAMKRAKLRGLKRNASVVLGNTGTRDDVTVLRRALDDADAVVRDSAAWAIERIERRAVGYQRPGVDAVGVRAE